MERKITADQLCLGARISPLWKVLSREISNIGHIRLCYVFTQGTRRSHQSRRPSMSPLCHQSLLYPALQALTRGQAPTSKGMRVYSRAEHERQGPRDMVSDFAKPHVPMRQQCHEAFLKHNKESHKSKYSRKHRVGSYSNAGLS